MIRLESLGYFEIDWRKLALVGAATGTAVSFSVWASAGQILGRAALEVEVVAGALALYLVVSAPRRSLFSVRISQARESVLLSESAQALLAATGSRTRTLMGLEAREPNLRAGLREARGKLLLGFAVGEAARAAAKRVPSYSASGVVMGVAELQRGSGGNEVEETTGIESASTLSRETKLPVFMAVCFFTPIVFTLFSSFYKVAAAQELVGLLFFEALLLDLAFQVCSADRKAV